MLGYLIILSGVLTLFFISMAIIEIKIENYKDE